MKLKLIRAYKAPPVSNTVKHKGKTETVTTERWVLEFERSRGWWFWRTIETVYFLREDVGTSGTRISWFSWETGIPPTHSELGLHPSSLLNTYQWLSPNQWLEEAWIGWRNRKVIAEAIEQGQIAMELDEAMDELDEEEEADPPHDSTPKGPFRSRSN